MSTATDDASDWSERTEDQRIEEANRRRAMRRGYLVFATDPTRAPDQAGYREVFATEAATSHQALAKIRPLTGGRRLRAFLSTGTTETSFRTLAGFRNRTA